MVRWLEYSGVLVVLGILADTAFEGLPVTSIVANTDLCNETVYSALAVAAELGLIWVEVGGKGVPIVKRYRLTGAGQRLGRIAQEVRREMSALPPPPRKVRKRRAADGSDDVWDSATAPQILDGS